jgi:TolB-like protein
MDQSNPERSSVAVLPFVNHSEDRSFDYLGDSIAGEITFALTRVPGLRVAARTSAFCFREGQHDVRQIGKALQSGNVVEGNVSLAGERLRITVQLIDTATGHCLGRSDTSGRSISLPYRKRLQTALPAGFGSS